MVEIQRYCCCTLYSIKGRRAGVDRLSPSLCKPSHSSQPPVLMKYCSSVWNKFRGQGPSYSYREKGKDLLDKGQCEAQLFLSQRFISDLRSMKNLGRVIGINDYPCCAVLCHRYTSCRSSERRCSGLRWTPGYPRNRHLSTALQFIRHGRSIPQLTWYSSFCRQECAWVPKIEYCVAEEAYLYTSVHYLP